MVDGRPRPNPKAEKWTLRVLGLRGFAVGLRPTVVSSFVGSAATISTYSSLSPRIVLEGLTLTRKTFNSYGRSCATLDGCQWWRRSRLSLSHHSGFFSKCIQARRRKQEVDNEGK